MKHSITVLVLLVLSASHGRDWGFTKDSVYECVGSASCAGWPIHDSVRIVNQGPDTLRFDSIAAELLTPGKTRFEVKFEVNPPAFPFAEWFILHQNGQTTYPLAQENGSGHPRSLMAPSGDSLRFTSFAIDRRIDYLPIGDNGSGTDTITARLIFIARDGRGRDTLFVTGIESYNPTSLRSFRSPKGMRAPSNLFFDSRGRRVDVSPGARPSAVPLLTPRD